jgi:signal transduction histidine kinase
VETVLTLYHNQLKQGVEVIREYDQVPETLCYPDELAQVWTNLIHNAIQAMTNQGILTVGIHAVDNQTLEVTINDNGPGIPPEIQPKIFEPFFTTKKAGEGSGLGLDIVRKIVEKHGGSIFFTSQPGNTTFHVRIPLITSLENPKNEENIVVNLEDRNFKEKTIT